MQGFGTRWSLLFADKRLSLGRYSSLADTKARSLVFSLVLEVCFVCIRKLDPDLL
jgi:hypothetical protein